MFLLKYEVTVLPPASASLATNLALFHILVLTAYPSTLSISNFFVPLKSNDLLILHLAGIC